jgi:hypothetical protein
MFGFTAFAQSSFAALGGNYVLTDVSESIQASDIEAGTVAFAPQIAETVQVSETQAARLDFTAAVSETVEASDTKGAVITTGLTIFEEVLMSATKAAQVDFAAAVSETAQVSDVEASGVDFAVAVSETVQLSDPNYGISLVLFVDFADTASFSETQAAQAQFVSSISETARASDVATATADFKTAISEALGLSAVDASYIDFRVSLQEQIRLYDNLSSRFLWELIPDGQDPGWSNIASNVNAGWALIDDSQVSTRDNLGTVSSFAGFAMGGASFAGGPSDIEPIFGWLTVGNSQNAGWADIQDSQTPAWTEIDTV